MTALAQVSRLARRVDAATPAHRDRAVDALRALAIAGVIGGHWLVTALVAGRSHSHHGTVLNDNSPLASMPWLAPLSWIFQTLAVFFLVGGFSAARGYRGEYLPLAPQAPDPAGPSRRRPGRGLDPGHGRHGPGGRPGRDRAHAPVPGHQPAVVPGRVRRADRADPGGLWLVRRFGASAAAFPVAVVAAADLVRFGLHGAGFHGPSWLGWVNLPAGWLVPYLLGIAWARGSLRGRRIPALMLAGGAAATAALIAWAGYPASMVGVNGAHISNLNPPTLAAVTFGIAQCGLALLLRDRLARLMRRPLAWAAIALVNLSAMTLFLWHQTAFVTVSSLGLLAGRVPGLLTAPAAACG